VSVLRMRAYSLARMMLRLETLARVALEEGNATEAGHYLDLRSAARRRRSALLRRMWKEERAHATPDEAGL
jgi:hypothetical protein